MQEKCIGRNHEDWRSPKGQERGGVLAEHLSYGYVMDSFFAK